MCKESKWPQGVPTVPCCRILIGHLSCRTKLDTLRKQAILYVPGFSIYFYISNAYLQGNQLTSSLMELEGQKGIALLGLLALGLNSLLTSKDWVWTRLDFSDETIIHSM